MSWTLMTSICICDYVKSSLIIIKQKNSCKLLYFSQFKHTFTIVKLCLTEKAYLRRNIFHEHERFHNFNACMKEILI